MMLARYAHCLLPLLLAVGVVPAAAQDAAAPPPAAAVPIGSIIGPVLNVSDITHSLKFYTDGLGMSLNMTMGPDARREYMLGFGADPRQPGLILIYNASTAPSPPIEQVNGYDRTVMRIADLDALAARLTAAGIEHGAIRDVAMGYRMMMVSDPDGYRYELVQIRARP